jgi:hypothetical protein
MKYSLYSFLTYALDGGEWSASRPGCILPPGKHHQYPLNRKLLDPQSCSGHRGYSKVPQTVGSAFGPLGASSFYEEHLFCTKYGRKIMYVGMQSLKVWEPLGWKKNPLPLPGSNPGCPACSQTLYSLGYHSYNRG